MSVYNLLAALAGAAVAIFCSHRLLGRRSMILFATGSAVLSMTAAALGGTIAPGTEAAAKNFVAFSVIYNVLYGSFSSAITWPISAEVVSSRLRVLTLSIATSIDYVFACKSFLYLYYLLLPRA